MSGLPKVFENETVNERAWPVVFGLEFPHHCVQLVNGQSLPLTLHGRAFPQIGQFFHAGLTWCTFPSSSGSTNRCASLQTFVFPSIQLSISNLTILMWSHHSTIVKASPSLRGGSSLY